MEIIEEARIEIEAIDKEMAQLFERRMNAVKKIAQYKKEHQLPIYDQGRETFLIIRNGCYIMDETIRKYYVDFLRSEFALSKRFQEENK